MEQKGYRLAMMTEAWVLRKSMEALKPFERRLEISSFFDCCATAAYLQLQLPNIAKHSLPGGGRSLRLGWTLWWATGCSSADLRAEQFFQLCTNGTFCSLASEGGWRVADCEGLQLVNTAGINRASHWDIISPGSFFFWHFAISPTPPGNKKITMSSHFDAMQGTTSFFLITINMKVQNNIPSTQGGWQASFVRTMQETT